MLVRVLLDGGSQRTVTEQLAEKLNYQVLDRECLTVGHFGGHHEEKTFRRVSVTLSSVHSCKTLLIEALVTTKIGDQSIPRPSGDFTDKLEHQGYYFTDNDQAESPKAVDVIIGSDYYWSFVTGNVRNLENGLKAVDTSLGWTLHGPVASCATVTHCNATIVLKVAVEEFKITTDNYWDLEIMGIKPDGHNKTQDADPVLDIIKSTVKMENRRYVVSLPWKPTILNHNNRENAQTRLNQLLRKLRRCPQLLQEYDAAIRKYANDGVAE
ncbi:hypothetical protein HPB49_002171 [Dermacentor silvarum]|uniref:Uncharacterized protein n=1 Tax=Dermacentor silvarum TaxID=543639 RepID=A0ACB8DSV0_DERSI|nr:hypothetical protein HPB49_002171 [Dermacentor silvarum]